MVNIDIFIITMHNVNRIDTRQIRCNRCFDASVAIAFEKKEKSCNAEAANIQL